jgi:hypothetical protein
LGEEFVVEKAIKVSWQNTIKDLHCGCAKKEADAEAQLALLSLLAQGKVSVIMPDPMDDNTWLWEAAK